MTTLPVTGIELIDRELEQHEFANADEAEVMAAKLLAAWRVLHSSGLNGDDAAPSGRSQRQRRLLSHE
jgi:hypothetical protein